MKIEEFELQLSSDLSWRKSEIISLILHSEKSNLHVLNKSVILLLYSHWEGYIKRSCKLYLKFLCDKNLKVSDLLHNFKALHLKDTISKSITTTDNLTIQNEISFINIWSKLHNKTFKLAKNDIDDDFENSYINTQSNLKPKVFKNILQVIGFDYKEQYQLKEVYINDRLLNIRNKIGHGSRVENDDSIYLQNISEIKKLKDIIFVILDATKDELIYCCENELYLVSNEDKRELYFNEREQIIENLFKNIEDQYAE